MDTNIDIDPGVQMFKFQYGAIKGWKTLAAFIAVESFQFQYGAIKGSTGT